jgi:putative toxin-antitoxin system antitoxin component (TIGR02293 family)
MAGVSLYVVIGIAIQTLKRWGNSLAVRIPANVANEAAFSEGQEVDVQVQHGQVMVRPHTGIRRFSRERFIQQLRGQQHSTCRRTWLRTVQAFAWLVGLDTLLERLFGPSSLRPEVGYAVQQVRRTNPSIWSIIKPQMEKIMEADLKGKASRRGSLAGGQKAGGRAPKVSHRRGGGGAPDLIAKHFAADEPGRTLSEIHMPGLKDLTHFGDVYRWDPHVRIHIIKSGVKADVFGRIARSMDRSKEQLSKTLGLSVTTIDRKAKAGENLSPEQGERVVGMAKLIGQVQTMVEQSGDPTGFDAAQWLARWLDEPLPALGGLHPAEYMDTAEGRDLVSNLLSMAQSGAYA